MEFFVILLQWYLMGPEQEIHQSRLRIYHSGFLILGAQDLFTPRNKQTKNKTPNTQATKPKSFLFVYAILMCVFRVTENLGHLTSLA